MTADKNRIKKTIMGAITISLIFLPSLWAEDYPQGYLGNGYREYLSGKIQNGYYVEVFNKMDMRQKERVDKRNQVEEILNFSSQAGPESANTILVGQFQQKETAENLKKEIAEVRQQREKVASAQTEFSYIKYSDGKTEYFKDGLATRVEDERVVDEFGNTSIKSTFNMQYNDRRLLTSYEATSKDNLGNTSRLFWYGVSYTLDSVFYGNKDTRANKNINDYYTKEIDSAGNVKLTHWTALNYEGKLLRAFSQTIEDSIYGTATFKRSHINYENNNPERPSSYREEGIGTDGLAYRLDRTKITYNNKDQLSGYHEESITTQIDGNKIKSVVDAQFRYLDVPNPFGRDVEESHADILLESIFTATTHNSDGSKRTETTKTTYNYDGNNQLIDASAQSDFVGQEAEWYEYVDLSGQLLTRNEDENGNITYSYKDPDSLETVFVPESQVGAFLREGNQYTGSAQTQYEILYGKPMAKQTDSHILYYGQNIVNDELLYVEDSAITYNNGLVNNLQRVLGSQENTNVRRPLLDFENKYQEDKEINITYSYDAKGNLITAQGTGKGGGWEYSEEKGWYGKFVSTITAEYKIILGKALRITYDEDKDYE